VIVTTHSDGVPVEVTTAKPSFTNPNQGSSRIVKALPASYYDQFLSKLAKERLPSPSEAIYHNLFLVCINKYIQFVVSFLWNQDRDFSVCWLESPTGPPFHSHRLASQHGIRTTHRKKSLSASQTQNLLLDCNMERQLALTVWLHGCMACKNWLMEGKEAKVGYQALAPVHKI
jgi:hypothetical protein